MKVIANLRCYSKNANAQKLHFTYDPSDGEWGVLVDDWAEGYGDNPQEALNNLENDLEDHTLIQYNNGFVLEEK